jgi:pimeloyl-ACP methyl ester carboxylesterase
MENRGFRPYFHHGLNKEIKLNWDFMISAQKMSWPEIKHPTVIIHGLSDEIVPIESSRKVAESSSNVELIEVEDGHRLGTLYTSYQLLLKRYYRGNSF